MGFPLSQAMRAAGELQGRLAPHCQRIQSAGGVRRRSPDVDDLVLVTIPLIRDVAAPPRRQRSLWEETAEDERPRAPVNALWDYLERATAGELPRFHGSYRRGERWGTRHRQLWWEGYPVELHATTQDSWGHILLLRTGPAEFAQRYLLTLQRRRYEARDGVVLRYGKPLAVPGERDAFRLVDWPYRHPRDRS